MTKYHADIVGTLLCIRTLTKNSCFKLQEMHEGKQQCSYEVVQTNERTIFVCLFVFCLCLFWKKSEMWEQALKVSQ